MVRVGHVGRGLRVDADGVEGDEGGVDDEGDERVEDVADVHYAFAEQEEEGEDGDDDVEVCDAGVHFISFGTVMSGIERGYIQLAPRQGDADGSVVCVGVNDLVGIAIPAMVGAFLPEFGAVEVWLCNAKESESGDFNGELHCEEIQDGTRKLPLPWDGCVAVLYTHCPSWLQLGRGSSACWIRYRR